MTGQGSTAAVFSLAELEPISLDESESLNTTRLRSSWGLLAA